MKIILLLMIVWYSLFAFQNNCTYNNINKYSIDTEQWIIFNQYGNVTKYACKNITSIKVKSIESIEIDNENFILTVYTKSGNYYNLKNYDFVKFNEMLKKD